MSKNEWYRWEAQERSTCPVDGFAMVDIKLVSGDMLPVRMAADCVWDRGGYADPDYNPDRLISFWRYAEWDERRIGVIGQNGKDGLHYAESVTERGEFEKQAEEDRCHYENYLDDLEG